MISSQHLYLTADLEIKAKICIDTGIMRNNLYCGAPYHNEASPKTNMMTPQNRIPRAFYNTFLTQLIL